MASAFSLSPCKLVEFADCEVQLGELETRWRSSGDGARGTVLMLHSLGLNRLAFDPLRLVLDPQWRVISFDQYAHGAAAGQTIFSLRDCVDAVLAAVSRCDGQPLHLVGHSMGGAIAALAAAEATAKSVASLTLIATPPVGGPAFRGRGDLTRERGIGAMIGPTLERWFGTGTSALQAGEALTYARSALLSMRSEGFANAWDALASFKGYWDLKARLPRTACIAAEDDASTPPQLMGQIIRACGSTQIPLYVVPKAGHMVPLTHPKAVAEMLETFWAEGSFAP